MYYFDNAATSYPKPEEVYAFMDQYYRENGYNAKRSYVTGNFTKAPEVLIEETRDRLLEFFNAKNKKVTFSHSATVAMNVVLQGLNFEQIKTVYISPFEHNAVLRTLHHLESRYKFAVIELNTDKSSDQYDLEGIKYQFQKTKPDLVVVNHASNVTGLIAPIDDICARAKKYNAITVIDIAQSAGQIDIDLNTINIDFAVFAGHKSMLGAFGIGGFISGYNIQLKPLIYGGTGVDSASPELPIKIPDRFEVGSINILAISSLYASLEYIKNKGFEVIKKNKVDRMRQLIELLRGYPDIKIYRNGPDEKYANVVSINFSGYSSDSIGEILSKRDIIVRTGLHCAPKAHKYLGTFPEGTVRLSVSNFTSEEDFKALEDALDYIEENS